MAAVVAASMQNECVPFQLALELLKARALPNMALTFFYMHFNMKSTVQVRTSAASAATVF